MWAWPEMFQLSASGRPSRLWDEFAPVKGSGPKTKHKAAKHDMLPFERNRVTFVAANWR
jgi:hypothetical protein